MDHGGQKIKQCRTMAGSNNSANVESFACRPECGDTRRTTHGHGACVHAWDVVSISTYQSFRKKKIERQHNAGPGTGRYEDRGECENDTRPGGERGGSGTGAIATWGVGRMGKEAGRAWRGTRAVDR